jgi:DNA-binding phage protein
MSEPLHDYDPAEVLDSAEAIEAFMADALETGDSAYVAKAEEVAKRAMQRLSDDEPASTNPRDTGVLVENEFRPEKRR